MSGANQVIDNPHWLQVVQGSRLWLQVCELGFKPGLWVCGLGLRPWVRPVYNFAECVTYMKVPACSLDIQYAGHSVSDLMHWQQHKPERCKKGHCHWVTLPRGALG